MKANRAKVVAVVMTLVLLAAVAVSETVKRGRMHRGGMFGDHLLVFMTHKLDLTSDQQSQVKQILAQQRPTTRPLMRQMMQNRIQLAQLLLNGNVQEAQINAIASQQAQITSQLVTQEAHVESQMIQVLNQDQKTKLGQMLQEHQQRMLNREHSQLSSDTSN